MKNILKIIASTLFLSLSLSSQAQEIDYVNIRQLIPSEAIVIQKGNGARKLFVFEDPNCHYCQAFESELAQINNVVIYVFLYPILNGDSVTKATHIWCSPNPTVAWQNWMLYQKAPQPINCANNPIRRNVALGISWRLNGTPSIIFEDGFKHVGILSAKDLEIRFSQIYKTPLITPVKPVITNNSSSPTRNESKPTMGGNSLFK